MLTFLQDILGFLVMVIQLIGMALNSLKNWIVMLPRFLAYLTAFFAWLPQPFAMFAIMGLSASILLFFLGRQS